ncbi:MAG: hypothetical protein LBU17_08980 [Treponema sp.]|nr:hypothetical protein [Treponema sp.]
MLTGSPRRKGNSDQLVDAFIRGAQAQGHSVQKNAKRFLFNFVIFAVFLLIYRAGY